MIELKRVRAHTEDITRGLVRRGMDADVIAGVLDKDKVRRARMQEVEALKSARNVASQRIAQQKQRGEDVSADVEAMRLVGEQIHALDACIKEDEDAIQDALLRIPNVPHDSVPDGISEADNVEVRRYGDVRKNDATHWDIVQRLKLVDTEAGARVTGARFVFYTGWGAKLERALASMMLDMHTEQHGYEMVTPPMIVHEHSLQGTGQLPKFADDAFRIAQHPYYLIPTAEVPVTNMWRGQMLSAAQLPMLYTAYSACFRQEAGAAGRDTRGLIRLHQFHKVELVAFATPQTSYAQLEQMTAHAENVLKALELPYRVVALCAGDLGFGASKTYDIEVWMPSSGAYREISSCSNMEAFQATRANIRYRATNASKPEFVHTLNGSGLAIDRTIAALIENHSTEDGRIAIPRALQPYVRTTHIPPLDTPCPS
jgi:seryl-tRNA synthetase